MGWADRCPAVLGSIAGPGGQHVWRVSVLMDFSKLNQNEKLAVYGSIALIVGGVVGYSYGLTVLGLLAAIAMLVLIFLPQFSPGTTLPGSRGSLMVAVGGLAGVAMVLAFLSALTGVLLVNTNLRDLFFLVAVAGGLLMAWAGWQEFQAEGGKFQIGSGASSTPAAAPPASEPPADARADAAPAASGDASSSTSNQPEPTSAPESAGTREPAAGAEREDDRPAG